MAALGLVRTEPEGLTVGSLQMFGGLGGGRPLRGSTCRAFAWKTRHIDWFGSHPMGGGSAGRDTRDEQPGNQHRCSGGWSWTPRPAGSASSPIRPPSTSGHGGSRCSRRLPIPADQLRAAELATAARPPVRRWDVDNGTPTLEERPPLAPSPGSAPAGVVWSRGSTVYREAPATGERSSYPCPSDVTTVDETAFVLTWSPVGSSRPRGACTPAAVGRCPRPRAAVPARTPLLRGRRPAPSCRPPWTTVQSSTVIGDVEEPRPRVRRADERAASPPTSRSNPPSRPEPEADHPRRPFPGWRRVARAARLRRSCGGGAA